MQCYRLTFTAPFHVDSRGNHYYEESNSFIHSDTLSAAIIATWAMIDPEQAQQKAQQPGFQLSSAFPFYQDCYFLPRSLNSQAITLTDDRLQEAKKLKKIQWLDSSLWKYAFNQTSWVDKLTICQEVLATSQQALPKRLWLEEERPRLAMERANNHAAESQLFNFSRIWFHEEGGLYFLAKFDSESDQKQFEMLLSLLADSGIGADRSNGNGCFTWKPGKNPGLQWATNETAVALSLVNPAPADCHTGWLENSAYKLVSRGGWIGNTGKRRQRLRMFAEGSVFAQPLQGRMVDVTGEYTEHKMRGFFVKAG